MKKIGIVTIVDNNNYGNRLQNYAVTKVYERMGFAADTLLLNQRKGNIKYIPRAIRMIMEPVKKKNKLKKTDPLTLARIRRFEKFNSENGISIKSFPIWNTTMLRNRYAYFSVGSDQIWNSNLDFGYGTEFLDFAAPEQRLTLSPSFGTMQVADDKKASFIKGLRGFEYLSVREESGAKLIHELTGQNAEVIVDPTMMLTKEDWMKVEKKPENMDVDSPYILEYFLGGESEATEKEISEFARKNQFNRMVLLDRELTELYCTDPGEFIYLIHHAELVATDSFHATVFSILFNKSFAVYERIGHTEMGSRITTLLKLFGISKNTLGGIKNIRRFDNTDVQEILEREKNRGYDFLRKEMRITGNE